jgi:hypothetical protein
MYMRKAVRRVAILAACMMQAACGSQSGKVYFPGTYELFVGTNESYSRSDFTKSTLLIRADGTFEQSCSYTSPQSNRNTKGTWHSDETRISFDPFLDCAGVFPFWDIKGGSLLVEGSTTKPLLLLNPDVNIFYEQSSD